MAIGQYLGLIGGIVGAIVGGVIGTLCFPVLGTGAGAAWGFTIGSMIGGVAGQIFWPEQAELNLPPPPQPHETRLQFSSWGAPIPIQYGSGRLAGNIIYMSDIVETIDRSRHRQDGVRYYEMVRTYTATFAIAFCEGTVPGVARIWLNNKIFVDWRNPDGPYYPIGGATYAAGNLDTSIDRRAFFFRIHLGAETQAADNTIASLLGASEVPAYRGIFYITFIDFPIGEFSGVPNIEVEVDDDIVFVEPVYRITENVDSDYGWTSGGASIRHDNIGCGKSGGISVKAFIKFPNVNIAPGSTVSEVTCILKVFAEYPGTTGIVNFEVRVNEADSASTPSNAAAFEAMAWSTTYVSGQHVYAGGLGTDTTVLNLAPLVQAIIDRPGWVSGNPIMFRFTPTSGNGVNDYVLWRDAYSGVNRPSLTVKYW